MASFLLALNPHGLLEFSAFLQCVACLVGALVASGNAHRWRFGWRFNLRIWFVIFFTCILTFGCTHAGLDRFARDTMRAYEGGMAKAYLWRRLTDHAGSMLFVFSLTYLLTWLYLRPRLAQPDGRTNP